MQFWTTHRSYDDFFNRLGCSPKFASSLRDLYDAVAQGEHERLQLGVHPKL